MKTTEKTRTQLKAGINLYAGTKVGEYFIGTLRQRIALCSNAAPGIYSALKAGLTSAEIAATYSLSDDQISELLDELRAVEFLETQTSAIQISERFISNIAERAAKAGDHSKDASFSQIKKRIAPELTVTRWLPDVCDSGVSKVSARQSAHIEISGRSRTAQHLYSALLASGVTNTQFAPSFRRGDELVVEEDLIGGYISATDIGQVFTKVSVEKSKSLALFPLTKMESAEELPAGFAEKVIKIHFGEIDPALLGLWMASGQEHLIISEISGGYLTISPIVKPGLSPCSRCCELTIADQSGATILEGASMKDEIPAAGAHYLAGLLASQLLNLIDTGSCTVATKAISIDLLDLCNTKHITVGRHPMCGCSWRWRFQLAHLQNYLNNRPMAKKEISKKEIKETEIPSSTAVRSAKMVSIPVGLAGRGVLGLGRQLIGQSPSLVITDIQEKTAEQLFKVLGELKGGAMKFGQALSVFEAALPENIAKPYREILTKLQESAPPLPTRVVHKVLAKELGENWRDNFTSFEDKPTASASIGQVHKGVWKDGRPVAVKIQYPGAAEALISDLNQIQRFAKIFQLVLPGLDMKPLLEELRARIIEEVDYKYEAEAQEACWRAFENDPDVAIPKVVMSADKVLVSEWLEGTPLSKIIAEGTQEERNNAGMRLARFHFTCPERAGLLHADPHPGNFRLLADGRIGVLDFGACNRLPNGFPEPFKNLLKHALDDDAQALYDGFKKDGFILPEVDVDPALVLDFLVPLVEPLRTETFKYSREWLRDQSARVGDPRNPTAKIGFQLNLPAEYVLIHRVTLGTTGIFCQLEAEGKFRDEALSWFPEIAPSNA